MTTRALPAAVLCLAALAGCGDAGADPIGSMRAPTSVRIDGGRTELRFGGVIVDVDPSIRFRSTTVSGTTDQSVQQTLAGHPFGVDGGVFRIGPATFGPVGDGDRVRVAADGVQVNGERRGDMPPARNGAAK